MVSQTDWHHQRGEASAALGEVLELAGRTSDARSAYDRALASYEHKEALPETEAMRRRLAELGD